MSAKKRNPGAELVALRAALYIRQDVAARVVGLPLVQYDLIERGAATTRGSIDAIGKALWKHYDKRERSKRFVEGFNFMNWYRNGERPRRRARMPRPATPNPFARGITR